MTISVDIRNAFETLISTGLEGEDHGIVEVGRITPVPKELSYHINIMLGGLSLESRSRDTTLNELTVIVVVRVRELQDSDPEAEAYRLMQLAHNAVTDTPNLNVAAVQNTSLMLQQISPTLVKADADPLHAAISATYTLRFQSPTSDEAI